MQRITLAKSAGFCFGVNRAVKLLEELVKKNQNVFTLGPIIHNPQVVKHFENKGVRIIDSPDECKEGDLIVVRTHGIPKDMMEKVKSISPNYCNATCPFVTKIHKIVSENSLKENVTLIAGDKSHPEVIGIRSYCNGRSFVFNSEKELDKIIEKLANEKPLLPKHKDHDLVGRFTSFRECHIEPDWLLIYKVDGVFLYLTLFRTGTHSDLF